MCLLPSIVSRKHPEFKLIRDESMQLPSSFKKSTTIMHRLSPSTNLFIFLTVFPKSRFPNKGFVSRLLFRMEKVRQLCTGKFVFAVDIVSLTNGSDTIHNLMVFKGLSLPKATSQGIANKVDSYAYLPSNFQHLIDSGVSATLIVFERATILLQRFVVPISSQDGNTKITERLQFVNKAAIKSFLTKYGDIIDCVEINEQLSLDHPLLKNHSIQIKPNFKESKRTLQNNRQSKVVAERMRCPIGSVPIKRLQKEDLQMQKFSSLAGRKFSKCSNSICTNTGFPEGHQYATLISNGKNFGVSGSINVWSPEVAADQLSDASVYVAADDGSLINGLASGWAVYPNLFQNSSRLYAYWTRDSGHSTGCFNLICPGFVQVSPKVYLGLVLQPISTYGGSQYFITISIKQDLNTKNWWLFYGDEGVGYWPKELLTTLSDGATRAGWGGEIYSPSTEAAPPMGSGHFPEEGPNKAAVIYGLNLFGSESPNKTDLKVGLSKPDCYKVIDAGDKGGQFGHYMFFGGPPNCKL